jgi:hypothetical protein
LNSAVTTLANTHRNETTLATGATLNVGGGTSTSTFVICKWLSGCDLEINLNVLPYSILAIHTN